MDEFSKELRKQLEGANKDEAWIEKLLAVATYEEYEKVLGEKDIKAPPELKEHFETRHADKTGKLEDDELEKVSGGENYFCSCPGKPDPICLVSMCPHLKVKPQRGIAACTLGYWHEHLLSSFLYN